MGWCGLKSEDYPVIIIGAGIGGLTTAAYLSQHGISSLLLERTNSLGGRCSTRNINGCNYEIGAIYVGGGVFDHLRKTFGITLNTTPVRCAVRAGGNFVTFPFSWKTLFELSSCGATWLGIFFFLYRSRILSRPDTFTKYKSVGQILDRLTSDTVIRLFLDSIFGVSGVSPYYLPSRYLYTKNPMAHYKTANPEYLKGGNSTISTLLSHVAKEKGKIVFNVGVKKILVNQGRVTGVATDKGNFSAQIVVSNVGVRDTVLKLTNFNDWGKEYFKQIAEMKPALKVVNIFLTFSRSIKFPLDTSVFFVSGNVNHGFKALDEGRFPTESMYILHVPSIYEHGSTDDHRATLQFYYPRGNIASHELDKYVHTVMHDGLDKLVNGLSKAVTNYTIYNPERYEKEFGFPPRVFGVSPDYRYSRVSTQTPITNLYCVGDSVAPDGPCVPQAMESGLNCARQIASQIKKTH